MVAIQNAVEEKGWTVVYTRWDDCRVCVAGRFKTTVEKDAFLAKIRQPNSGWLEEELMTIAVINDYSYMLCK